MTKAFALTLLAATFLAGCGVAPTTASAQRGGVQAKSSAEKRRVQLRIPAQVMGYVDDYAQKLQADWGREYEKDMYGRPTHPKFRVKFDRHDRMAVKVLASADGFKTTFDENGYNAWRAQSGRDILVPFVAPVGPVKYYLELRAEIESVATGKVVKRLPVHHISDMGRNFDGRLEVERL